MLIKSNIVPENFYTVDLKEDNIPVEEIPDCD